MASDRAVMIATVTRETATGTHRQTRAVADYEAALAWVLAEVALYPGATWYVDELPPDQPGELRPRVRPSEVAGDMAVGRRGGAGRAVSTTNQENDR